MGAVLGDSTQELRQVLFDDPQRGEA